jgi:glycine cleavage system H protein
MKYTNSHEWIFLEKDIATVGISFFAKKHFGDIVYINLPKIGKVVKALDEVCILESTKSAVDIYSPVSGKITQVNKKLLKDLKDLNASPEDRGWLFKIKMTNLKEYENFLDEKSYKSKFC